MDFRALIPARGSEDISPGEKKPAVHCLRCDRKFSAHDPWHSKSIPAHSLSDPHNRCTHFPVYRLSQSILFLPTPPALLPERILIHLNIACWHVPAALPGIITSLNKQEFAILHRAYTSTHLPLLIIYRAAVTTYSALPPFNLPVGECCTAILTVSHPLNPPGYRGSASAVDTENTIVCCRPDPKRRLCAMFRLQIHV